MLFRVGFLICTIMGFALSWDGVQDVPGPKEVDCLRIKAAKALLGVRRAGKGWFCFNHPFFF